MLTVLIFSFLIIFSAITQLTLLSLMCGLIKPTHGNVIIENECISEMADNSLSRSLIKQPSVIFADEPTGSVDEETATEILEHLLYLKKEKQVTIVVATHGNIPEMMATVFLLLKTAG